jgi:hypothetical protein
VIVADLKHGLEMEHLNMIHTAAFRVFRIPLRPGITTVGESLNELHSWQTPGVLFLLHCCHFFGDEMRPGKVGAPPPSPLSHPNTPQE